MFVNTLVEIVLVLSIVSWLYNIYYVWQQFDTHFSSIFFSHNFLLEGSTSCYVRVWRLQSRGHRWSRRATLLHASIERYFRVYVTNKTQHAGLFDEYNMSFDILVVPLHWVVELWYSCSVVQGGRGWHLFSERKNHLKDFCPKHIREFAPKTFFACICKNLFKNTNLDLFGPFLTLSDPL